MRLANRRVSVVGMHPAVWPPLFKLDTYWRGKLGYEVIITSGSDGEHSVGSDHYWGGGVDVRTWTTADSRTQVRGDERKELLRGTKRVLGPDFFVLDEGTHFHISYRPRRGPVPGTLLSE